MKDFEIDRDLTRMYGKLFMYRGENRRIESHTITEKIVRINTDLGEIKILKEDFKSMLSDFLPVEENRKKETALQLGVNIPATVEKRTIISSLGTDLTAVLRDNIDKIKADKSYIPQAAAINDQIKSVIDLARTEVELIKAMR